MSDRNNAALIRSATARTQPLFLLLDLGADGGLTWCRPGRRLDELEWSARHAPATLTPSDIMGLAEVASAFRALIAKPAAERNAIIARMREHDDSDAEVTP